MNTLGTIIEKLTFSREILMIKLHPSRSSFTSLNSRNHIEEICKTASRKLNVLAILAPYTAYFINNINKRRTLMNAFFKSQFN